MLTYSLSILIAINAHSQKSIGGAVLDSNDEPVTYAHVFLKNYQNYGTVTNEVGRFSFKLEEAFLSDTLVVSILGFETYYLPLANLSNKDSSELTITLVRNQFLLEEVTIFSDSYLRYLLKEAVKKIPQNYPTKEHQLKAYYQDYTISDGKYSEFIEADVSFKSNGYLKNKDTYKCYLNQIRKSDDNRNLPDRLKGGISGIHLTYELNPLECKSFSYLKNISQAKDYNILLKEIDKSKSLEIVNQTIQDGDTIITIKMSDPMFVKVVSGSDRSMLFTNISINLTDMAFLRIQFGSIWDTEKDIKEVQFRKINDLYYPSIIRSVTHYKFNNQSKTHFNARTLIFYKLLEDKAQFQRLKNKLKRDVNVRRLKYKYDETFWGNYSVSSKLSETEIIKASLNRKKKLKDQFEQNAKRRAKF